ncbi:MAG: YeiH family protein [Burkholderiales bacterium]
MIFTQARALVPGTTAAIVIAIAALFLAEHYGASSMLFALLLGMALNFLGHEGRTVVGVQWSASTLLRIGIALLGLRITVTEISQLGWPVTAMVIVAVILTICFGAFVSQFTTGARDFGVLTGGAVAICGASAALAISAVLPRHAHTDRDTTFTVIGVTALSTIAMVIYPLISHALGFSERHAGIFLGATIHDVAQVIGAGFSVSPDAGETATVVKLLRVAMLLPVILVFSIMLRRSRDQDAATRAGKRPPLLPWFAVAFGGLVLINSLIVIPKGVSNLFSEVSRFLLVTAIAAIGMKTQLKELTVLGWRPVVLIVSETLFLATFVVLMLQW